MQLLFKKNIIIFVLMNLVLDIGNTFAKIAVFKQGELLLKNSLKISDLERELAVFYSQFKFENAIVSNVGKLDKTIFKKYKNINFLFLTSKIALPFKNNYATPATLGVDRIALVAAAIAQFPKQNCLVIDAGTCITYDFVSENAEYFGGAISSGLKMRYKSLNYYTANLPLLEKIVTHKIIGDSTKDAMHIGVEKGVLYEIEGFIADFRNHYANFIIILTGGDAKHLSKSIKSSIFVRPNFLIEGLTHILEYNLSL
jgi:type III pantothenate kinase